MGLKVVGSAFIALAVVACSSQPREQSAPAPAPAAANVAPAAASPDAAAAKGQAPVLNRTLISAGYKAQTIKGEVFYCRTVDVTNTAFKKKVCLNESQIKDEERKIKQMQDEMVRSRTNPGCMGPGCGG